MKKGVTPGMLVTIIGLVATLLVMIVVVYPAFQKLLMESGEQGQCQFSLLLSTVSKQATFGFGEIPPQCKTKQVSISKDDLDAGIAQSRAIISKYHRENGPRIVAGSLQASAADLYPQTIEAQYQHTLEWLIADEMIDCADKGWRGKLPIDGKFYYESALAAPGSYTCILCSRIRFNSDLQTLFTPRLRNGGFWITPFLHAMNTRETTYWDYLSKDVDPVWLDTLTYASFDINQPYAVLFVAGTERRADGIHPITQTVDSTGVVGLFPYDKITTDLGWSEVVGIEPNQITETIYLINPLLWPAAATNYLINTVRGQEGKVSGFANKAEGKAKCAVIIGD